MKVYSCCPFLNEFKLLDLKVAEESDIVDQIFVLESNQTLHCNEKPLHLEGKTKYIDHPKVTVNFIKDRFKPNNHYRNDWDMKNSVLEFFEYEDDDVLIFCDLDEINKKEDLPYIIDECKKYGHVTFRQQLYYYKINLLKGNWTFAYAITGAELRKKKEHVYNIRNAREKIIPTNGKHFSYLMHPKDISYKISNAGHPEYMHNVFTDTKKIEERIDKNLDPFDRKIKATGKVIELRHVEIDETYPNTILNNLDDWKEFIK